MPAATTTNVTTAAFMQSNGAGVSTATTVTTLTTTAASYVQNNGNGLPPSQSFSHQPMNATKQQISPPLNDNRNDTQSPTYSHHTANTYSRQNSSSSNSTKAQINAVKGTATRPINEATKFDSLEVCL